MAAANIDTVTNFASGTDKFGAVKDQQIGTVTIATDTKFVVTSKSLDDSVANLDAVVAALGNEQMTASTAASMQAKVYTFANGAAAGSYMVIDGGDGGNINAANDYIVKLAGTTTVTADDFQVVTNATDFLA